MSSGPSQYQKKVSKLTNLAHVLSDSMVLLKKTSKKLHCSRETCGLSQAAKGDS